MNAISKLKRKHKESGLFGVAQALTFRFVRFFQRVESIGSRHNSLSRRLSEMFDYTVAYGPFYGVKLSREIRWGASDLGSMWLGIYEQEVLEILARLGDGEKTFIDVGAADGYYGIGCVKSGLYKRSLCYEISEVGQRVILKNALLNNISDKVEVHGAADLEAFRKIPSTIRENCALLIDIEGAEFDLVSEDFLNEFSQAPIVIEVHDNFFEDGSERYKELLDRCTMHFKCNEVRTKARDLSPFKELEFFPDDDRWIICSESRRRLGKWLFLEPKNSL